MKKLSRREKYLAAGVLLAVLLGAGAAIPGLWGSHRGKGGPDREKKKVEAYMALNAADRETADLYAGLYETEREKVAEIQAKTGDWEQTHKELEKDFFTIPENIKYQMAKEGYSLDDLEEAEKLSARTGRKAMELAKAKGKATENRGWPEVVKDSEIHTTEEQLGLTGEQVQQLEDRSLDKGERVEIAILLMNGTYTFDEVIQALDAGKTVGELKKQNEG